MSYIPSAKDAPNGPRNNRDELDAIATNTANFSTDPPGPVEDLNPFSPNNAPGLTLVVLMRVYDVGMALLNEQNSEAARKLHELHSEGKILGSEPYIDLTAEATDAEDSE